MYADRHARPEGIKPGSLIVAVGINAGLIGALLFINPVFVIKPDRPLVTTNVPIDPPPEPTPPEIKPERSDRAVARPERVDTSTIVIPTPDDSFVLPPPLPPMPPLPLPPLPTGDFTKIDPPVAPVLVEARLDPRYARDLQPQYPAGERRAEREGYATVRVTIGSDGRVTGAECVAATSEAFCAVTKSQALAKWRFRPATRDGAAVEASTVMTVRFRLEA